MAAFPERRRRDRPHRAIFPIHGEVPAVGGGWGLPLLRSDDRQLLPAQAPLITFVQRMKAAPLAQYLARDPVVTAPAEVWDAGRVQAPKQTARAFGRPARPGLVF